MKRAKVFRRERDGKWRVMLTGPNQYGWRGLRGFPTHAEALRFALAEVGLTEKNNEKEKGR